MIKHLARGEGYLRPLLVRLPPALAIRLYSQGRLRVLGLLAHERPLARRVPDGLGRELWGLRFRSPILNAAGMWKKGDGGLLALRQGAGGFLAGTTTHQERVGNRRDGVFQPFAPYPGSGAASNFLGLPNPGHAAVAPKLRELRTACPDDFPIGVSVAAVAEGTRDEADMLEKLLDGLRLYEEAGVDFIELNESCPNTEDGHGLDALEARLAIIRDGFLERRQRHLPVVLKFSCDTALDQVPGLVDLLLENALDGVNFGNTSVEYDVHRAAIRRSEQALYDDFTSRFGGGVSGRPLKDRSLVLARAANDHLRTLDGKIPREFHVLRTGGVENASDLAASDAAGVSLNQWYTGYFESFSRHGHNLYRKLYKAYKENKA